MPPSAQTKQKALKMTCLINFAFEGQFLYSPPNFKASLECSSLFEKNELIKAEELGLHESFRNFRALVKREDVVEGG